MTLPKTKHKQREKVVLKKEEPLLFSFEFLEDGFISKQKTNNEVCKNFIIRLHKLSVLGWKEIEKSDRHGFGYEQIPLHQFKPQMPSCITEDRKTLTVFRADGTNHTFAGFRKENIFYIVFIETQFGTLYNH